MLEVEKYRALWETSEYRGMSFGEQEVEQFLLVADPERGEEVIDFGCGTGRAAKKLQDYGLKVTAIDFAGNCLDPDVSVPLVIHDLTKEVPIQAKYGYCSDMMEHVPPEDVDDVLRNILRSAKYCYFQISCIDDIWGELIGERLHLTVHDISWWKEKFSELHAKILWEHDSGSHCSLYVTGWAEAAELIKNGKINVPEERLRENIRVNSNQGYQLCEPHLQQDLEIMLLGGGPTMKEFESEIRERRQAGMPLVTVNGAYNWCLERGITPSAQVMVDAREFNRKFVSPPVDGCKYLLASQCDPSVFDSLPRDQVYLWHSVTDEASSDYIKSITKDPVWPVPGGSTVVLRAIPLLRMLGFSKFHIYGFDSCVMGDHHSYPQAENDKDIFFRVRFGGREFTCAPWMISQAEEFKTLAQKLDADAQLEVYGDGLIAHIIKTAASKD